MGNNCLLPTALDLRAYKQFNQQAAFRTITVKE